MIQRYAVFNPMTGTHTYVDTMEEAVATKTTFAEALYDAHTFNSGINQVSVDEDGSILWSQHQMAAPDSASVQVIDPNAPAVFIPIQGIPLTTIDPDAGHS